MNFFMKIWRSSLGKKYIMGISGFMLVFFIFTHMMGNLQLFVGPYWINTYGQFLHERHEILWPVRIVLLTLVVLHIWSAFKLRAENRAARPVEVDRIERLRADGERGVDGQDHPVLVLLREDGRDLPLAERVVERVVEVRRGDAQPRRRGPVENEASLEAGALLIARHVA